jgi:hypothetical protein
VNKLPRFGEVTPVAIPRTEISRSKPVTIADPALIAILMMWCTRDIGRKSGLVLESARTVIPPIAMAL